MMQKVALFASLPKTPYLVEIQRETKKERLKPLFFVVPPGFELRSSRADTI